MWVKSYWSSNWVNAAFFRFSDLSINVIIWGEKGVNSYCSQATFKKFLGGAIIDNQIKNLDFVMGIFDDHLHARAVLHNTNPCFHFASPFISMTASDLQMPGKLKLNSDWGGTWYMTFLGNLAQIISSVIQWALIAVFWS